MGGKQPDTAAGSPGEAPGGQGGRFFRRRSWTGDVSVAEFVRAGFYAGTTRSKGSPSSSELTDNHL